MTTNTLHFPAPPASPPRVFGIDAYRGLVMCLMLAEALHLGRVSEALPEQGWLAFLATHQSHVEWTGCTLHDLIQPSFSFLVGVALPFSLVSRRRQGQTVGRMALHAAWRAVALTALGVLLRLLHGTSFTLEDTLSQIGLGYFPLFLLGLAAPRAAWFALACVLTGYWLAMVAYPAAGPDFDYAAVGVAADWPYHASGVAAHFNKNSNLAWAFDTWFLNLFPRAEPFRFNGGGYCTLNFVPTLGTMILGLIAGRKLQENASPALKMLWLLGAGAACCTAGWLLDAAGLCPSVKRIWTPSWTLFSGGWCCWLLGACYGLCDLLGWRRWALPLVVVGANSIVAYCLAHVAEGPLQDGLRAVLGDSWSSQIAGPYAPLWEGTAVLAVFFALLAWMYRRRIFVRI